MDDPLRGYSMQLMLADFAQPVQGKLYVLGGGWNLKPETPTPMAIAAVVGIPWSQARQPHKVDFDLYDADGHPFSIGDTHLVVSAQIKIEQHPGLPAGITFNVPVAINIIPIPIPAGDYVWIGKINGRGKDEWRAAFTVLSELPPPGQS